MNDHNVDIDGISYNKPSKIEPIKSNDEPLLGPSYNSSSDSKRKIGTFSSINQSAEDPIHPSVNRLHEALKAAHSRGVDYKCVKVMKTEGHLEEYIKK